MINNAPARRTTQTRLMAIGIRHDLTCESRGMAEKSGQTHAVLLRVCVPSPTAAPMTCPTASMSCQLDNNQRYGTQTRQKTTNLETQAPLISIGGISERYNGALLSIRG